MLGTLSAVLGHPINGYLPIPAWCSVQPDNSVREPPKEAPQALASAARSGSDKNRKGESESDFYTGSGSESESESESGSSPDNSSIDGSESSSYASASSSTGEDEESGSESSDFEESGSDYDGTSDDEDDESSSSVASRSSESSESSSDSSDSSSTEGEEGLGLLVLGPGSSSAAAATTTYGASAPAPHTEDLTGLVERMSVSAREESASPQLGASAAVRGGLASLSTAGLREPGGALTALGRTSSTSSVLSTDAEGDASASFPSTLLGHQASGGLEVDYRYARGRASALSRPSTTLCLRLTLANHGETPVRRIRVVAPRDGTPMELFPEIQLLAAGATSTAAVGIDFGGKAKDVSGVSHVAMTHFWCVRLPVSQTSLPTWGNSWWWLNVR